MVEKLTIHVEDADLFRAAFQRFSMANRNIEESGDGDDYAAFHGHKLVRDAAAEDMAVMIVGVE